MMLVTTDQAATAEARALIIVAPDGKGTGAVIADGIAGRVTITTMGRVYSTAGASCGSWGPHNELVKEIPAHRRTEL